MADPKRLSVPSNPARALRDLSRRQAAEPVQEDEEYTTILQSDKPTDRQTIKQNNTPTNKPTDQPTDLLTDQQTTNQTDRPSNKQRNSPSRKPTNGEMTANLSARTDTRAVATPARSPEVTVEAAMPRRADGRTSRARQETADRTLVTSLRLAVSTVEQLDEYCWKHRQRKQDVIQAALDLYFATMEADE